SGRRAGTTVTRRWRLLAVLTALSAGALTLIATTQTWYTVWLRDGADGALAVAGADAVPVLAPLSLAVLALGAALSIAGRVLAYVLGVLMTAIGATMSVVLIPVAVGPTTSALARTVT